MHPTGLSVEDLEQAYRATLIILFRLLFVAYAEDRDHLPLHASRNYREHSLKRIAQRLEDVRRKDVAFADQDFLWSEVGQIWKAVNLGNPAWHVPTYNGRLFASDIEVSELGARIAKISLPDREFVPALAASLPIDTRRAPQGRRGRLAMSPRTGLARDRSASAEGLPAVWRSRAKALRRYGSDAPAVALERCAGELETTLRERDETGLSLVEAARESGYSADHLGRLVRDGKLPSAGRPGAPRIARRHLPRKATAEPRLAPTPRRRRPTNEQLVRSIIERGIE